MTYRHHLANLIEHDDNYALYSYTPDSITAEHWGKIRFSIKKTSKYEVLEYAMDGGSKEWKETVCIALSRAFERRKNEEDGAIPDRLLFVA